MIVIGTPVIINETDRPCTSLITVLVHIDGDIGTFRYLNADIIHQDMYEYIANVHPVHLFGVQVLRSDNDFYTAIQYPYHTKIKYKKDNSPRYWQNYESLQWYAMNPTISTLVILQPTK